MGNSLGDDLQPIQVVRYDHQSQEDIHIELLLYDGIGAGQSQQHHIPRDYSLWQPPRTTAATAVSHPYWESLETPRANSRLSLLDKILRSRVAIDSGAYLKRSNTRTRTVNSVKMERYSARRATYQNSFFPRTIPQWNTIPNRKICM